MKAKVSFTLGRATYTFDLDGNDEKEILHRAAVLGNPPHKCNECENYKHFKLDSNKDSEGNIYVNVVCKCGAKAKLGYYKTGGYFWHKLEKYVPKNQDNGHQQEPQEEQTPVEDDEADSLPF